MSVKKLCSWSKKKIKRDLHELKTIVSVPTHLCRTCGRAANVEARLCKPERIDG
jgi:hypothetical protein